MSENHANQSVDVAGTETPPPAVYQNDKVKASIDISDMFPRPYGINSAMVANTAHQNQMTQESLKTDYIDQRRSKEGMMDILQYHRHQQRVSTKQDQRKQPQPSGRQFIQAIKMIPMPSPKVEEDAKKSQSNKPGDITRTVSQTTDGALSQNILQQRFSLQRGNLNTAGSIAKPIIASAVEAMVDRSKQGTSHNRDNRYVLLSSPHYEQPNDLHNKQMASKKPQQQHQQPNDIKRSAEKQKPADIEVRDTNFTFLKNFKIQPLSKRPSISIQKGPKHHKTCRGSEVTSPQRLAPLAASVKLDASCGVNQTPFKDDGVLPPMTPTERCLSGGGDVTSLNSSHLRRTHAFSNRMHHEADKIRVNTAFKMQLNLFEEFSNKVRPPVSQNYLAGKLERKIHQQEREERRKRWDQQYNRVVKGQQINPQQEGAQSVNGVAGQGQLTEYPQKPMTSMTRPMSNESEMYAVRNHGLVGIAGSAQRSNTGQCASIMEEMGENKYKDSMQEQDHTHESLIKTGIETLKKARKQSNKRNIPAASFNFTELGGDKHRQYQTKEYKEKTQKVDDDQESLKRSLDPKNKLFIVNRKPKTHITNQRSCFSKQTILLSHGDQYREIFDFTEKINESMQKHYPPVNLIAIPKVEQQKTFQTEELGTSRLPAFSELPVSAYSFDQVQSPRAQTNQLKVHLNPRNLQKMQNYKPKASPERDIQSEDLVNFALQSRRDDQKPLSSETLQGVPILVQVHHFSPDQIPSSSGSTEYAFYQRRRGSGSGDAAQGVKLSIDQFSNMKKIVVQQRESTSDELNRRNVVITSNVSKRPSELMELNKDLERIREEPPSKLELHQKPAAMIPLHSEESAKQGSFIIAGAQNVMDSLETDQMQTHDRDEIFLSPASPKNSERNPLIDNQGSQPQFKANPSRVVLSKKQFNTANNGEPNSSKKLIVTRNPSHSDLNGSANMGGTLNHDIDEQHKSNLSYYESKEMTQVSAGVAVRFITNPTLNKIPGANSPAKESAQLSFRNGFPLSSKVNTELSQSLKDGMMNSHRSLGSQGGPNGSFGFKQPNQIYALVQKRPLVSQGAPQSVAETNRGSKSVSHRSGLREAKKISNFQICLREDINQESFGALVQPPQDQSQPNQAMPPSNYHTQTQASWGMKYQWKDKKPNTQAGSKRGVLLPQGRVNQDIQFVQVQDFENAPKQDVTLTKVPSGNDIAVTNSSNMILAQCQCPEPNPQCYACQLNMRMLQASFGNQQYTNEFIQSSQGSPVYAGSGSPAKGGATSKTFTRVSQQSSVIIPDKPVVVDIKIKQDQGVGGGQTRQTFPTEQSSMMREQVRVDLNMIQEANAGYAQSPVHSISPDMVDTQRYIQSLYEQFINQNQDRQALWKVLNKKIKKGFTSPQRNQSSLHRSPKTDERLVFKKPTTQEEEVQRDLKQVYEPKKQFGIISSLQKSKSPR